VIDNSHERTPVRIFIRRPRPRKELVVIPKLEKQEQQSITVAQYISKFNRCNYLKE
jgi:hypothetical protein